jgi:hypothetical protein
MGATSKANEQDQNGKFGEGMKTGLLVLKRDGCDIEILNGDETWKDDFRYYDTLFDPRLRRSLHISVVPGKTGKEDELEIVLKSLRRNPYKKCSREMLAIAATAP